MQEKYVNMLYFKPYVIILFILHKSFHNVRFKFLNIAVIKV